MRNKRGLLQIFKTCSTKYLLKKFHVVQKTKYTKQNPPKNGGMGCHSQNINGKQNGSTLQCNVCFQFFPECTTFYFFIVFNLYKHVSLLILVVF